MKVEEKIDENITGLWELVEEHISNLSTNCDVITTALEEKNIDVISDITGDIITEMQAVMTYSFMIKVLDEMKK